VSQLDKSVLQRWDRAVLAVLPTVYSSKGDAKFVSELFLGQASGRAERLHKAGDIHFHVLMKPSRREES